VLLVAGATPVRVPPPELYPVPETSFEVVKAVDAASRDALLVYNANLNVSAEFVPNLCTPNRSSFLKEVHIACVIAMLNSPYGFC
jgi:hypothetical protein